VRFTHSWRTEPGNSPGDLPDRTRAPSASAHHVREGRRRSRRAVPAGRLPRPLPGADRRGPGVRVGAAHGPVVDAAPSGHGGHPRGHARPGGGGGVRPRHPHAHQRRHPSQPAPAGGGGRRRPQGGGAAAQPGARSFVHGPLRAAHRPPRHLPGGPAHHGPVRSVAPGDAGPGACLALNARSPPSRPHGRAGAHRPGPGHGRSHQQHVPAGRHRLPQPPRVRPGRRPAAHPLAVDGPDGDPHGPAQRRPQRASPDGGARHQHRPLPRRVVRGRGAGGGLAVCRRL
jgi:hypothetical protein